ncbi:retrovirus-related pol polyprotein from transposon opus [Plakobranchus ocellatus]|uniref:Retrovirus-related pol polyprotein from transposon opus n=1 Tax=Plakobranchus ocellatus TaxID=259542 RepID=A0AAV4DGL5_9GAST|nr:retrovirus-related pol polyprotein from transposon opus [Plakobranchus ocellatus]
MFDSHLIITPADVFQGMENDRYFSKIDLSKGYWQILVYEEDVPKTTFVTMDCRYEFMRMPFVMMNSGATLIRAAKILVRGIDREVDYVDHLLVHTSIFFSICFVGVAVTVLGNHEEVRFALSSQLYLIISEVVQI